jgi:cytochrome b
MTTPELLSDFGAVESGAAAEVPPAAGVRRILLWDLPLRVFHWSLAAAVTAAIVTGELGGAWMPWHGRAGLLIAGLLVFRVVWGVLGSATSRFAQFAPTPGRLAAYLRGRWRGVGHNPLGALSVFALLGLLSLQVATGLFGDDDIAFAGPLNHLVGDQAGARLTGWHRLLADGLFALLALHLLAIAFHVVVKRHRLVRPMITGRLDVAAGQPLPRPARSFGRFGLLSAVAIAAAAVLALAGAGEEGSTVGPASDAVSAPVAPQPLPASSAPAW